MPEIIQDWLGTKLGLLIDMAPNRFGRVTKDGKVLANLLYNYGVIPVDVLKKVKESSNYHECLSNLSVLKPWLKYIGVTHDNSTFEKMACGEGSAAISVFYSVYLNLERKDRLHYISAQKERRPSPFSCDKFKVSWVPERFVSGQAGDAGLKLAAPIYENREMIDWHKAKCEQIVEQIKKTKSKFRKVAKKKKQLRPLVSKHASSKPLDKRQAEAEETLENINSFERNHPEECRNLNFAELMEMKNLTEMQPPFIPNMSDAKNMLDNMKRQKKGEVYARNFQQKMQNVLLEEQWKEIIEKQEEDFERKVCANLLKQSQYEKQMMTKLSLLRNQKRVLVENRKRLECLKIDRCQQEYDETVQRNMELRGEYWEDEQIERERIAELHRRIYDERVRIRREMIRNECRKIFEALVDIAIRIAEHREWIGAQIPKALMKDMKELFYKDLPIFDILEHLEDVCEKDTGHPPCQCPKKEDRGEWEEEADDLQFIQLKAEELERQSVLDECDFNDYLQLMGPWMIELLLPNDSETEGSQLVLGYIVHKILSVKYPAPNAPAPVRIKPMKPISAVHGLNDDSALDMLTDLMEACKVLVVKVDDAINFVLLAYKEELSVVTDIDVTFQNLTEEALRRRSSDGKEKDVSKKLQLLKVECSEMSGEEPFMLDKEVQTPRMIPEDNPPFSSNAELGKLAFEALGAGDPVPDSVIAHALVAYIVSKQDSYDGLVIINYPLLYSQASDLEFLLTGYRTLPLLEETETLEDVEEFSYRGPWGDPSKDSFGQFRTSRLVPKPEIFEQVAGEIPETFFDSVIKMKKVGGAQRRPSDQTNDSDEFNLMERFYSSFQILFSFEYQNLNFQTMKNLGRQILGERDDVTDPDLLRKSSAEVFGSIISELNEKWEQKRKPGRDGMGGVKKLTGEVSVSQAGPESEVTGTEGTAEGEQPRAPQPGDPTWDWAAGDQPEELLTALASVWENMEAVYVEDFKKLFFCLRVHRSNLTNYCGFIRNSLRTLMKRPDEKQKVLSDFQQMFNDIDEDLRPDRDIKCELHVRVSELEQALMAIADERKRNSIQDATKVAQNGWVAEEMANLINLFLTALQLEADRSIDSCQVITDYYTSLQQKVPEAKAIGKVAVPKLHVQDQKYSISSTFSYRTPSWASPTNSDVKRRYTAEKLSKTRSMLDKRRRSSESLTGAAEFITEILKTLTLPEDGVTPFHTFFTDTVQIVTSEVRNTLEACLGEARKTEKPSTKQTKTSRKPSETNSPPANEKLTLECVTALQNEISRFAFRSQLILARGIFELNDFLAMILNMLCSLSEEITEMYLKEIHSISECCQVFRCAIEREIGIKPVLELKQEEFFVHLDCAGSSSEEEMKPQVSEEEKRSTFNLQQLNLLFGKLQKVAPEGEIVKRALVYILEDLRMLNSEVENGRCLPEIWNDIEPDDVTTVMNEVFQDLEIVHWKDFIIYALDVPLPSERDILSMRKIFRKFDPHVTELVTRENYDCVTLWFEKFTDDEEMEKSRNVKDFLYRMYQVNDFQTNYSALLLAFCKDENPVVGFEKALALAMGKSIRPHEESPRDSLPGEIQSFDLGLFDDSDRESEKPPCCPTNNTTIKCIPTEKIVRCECKLPEIPLESSTDTEQDFLLDEDAREDFYHGTTDARESSRTSLIPYNILSSLLKASYPLLPQLTILLDCEQTFQETLNGIYDSLESYNDTLEVEKLVEHKFIKRLLHSTNKFKHVNLKTVLSSLAKDKTPPSRAACVTGKPNVISCLRN